MTIRMSVMWTVKMLGLAVVALPLGVELLGLLLRRLRPARTLNEVLFFPSELACVEHIFTSLSPGAVLALHARGVVVRILSDRDYIAISGSQIGVLRKAGICVRCDANSVHMHHKFALVDGRLLITGSLNWTLTAVQSNTENLVVTEEAELLRPFAEEFHRLWERNDPARCLHPKRPKHNSDSRTYDCQRPR
ncbi:Mitochondrial cardiolipin hydrolase [Liparis tanakae]|uniref:Mitochondrial cardiolipin hydrolase n=1 Tax=Liparis tanakae TaxID=230148 RepID=A0A4Z2J057_9TELE|nr:Mitochondrial cardiolipin hydrolase [Liparis tanakae]